jgi:hypothetical protein
VEFVADVEGANGIALEVVEHELRPFAEAAHHELPASFHEREATVLHRQAIAILDQHRARRLVAERRDVQATQVRRPLDAGHREQGRGDVDA